MVNKVGWTNGNPLILKIAMDGMNLGPPDPAVLQARDAILLGIEWIIRVIIRPSCGMGSRKGGWGMAHLIH